MNKVYGIYDIEKDYLIQSFKNYNGNTKTAMYSKGANANNAIETMSSYYNAKIKENVHINETKRNSLVIVRLGIMDEDSVDWEN